MKTNTISEKLNKTGLVLEMVDEAMDKAPINAYYGVNVTKTNSEPIDQIQGFIIAKRIQEYNQEMYGDPGTFIVFIGGLFEVLNAKDIAEVERIITINTPTIPIIINVLLGLVESPDFKSLKR